MRYYYSGLPYSDELYHHGINGQKWYVRRFQNEDGSLTAAGKARYYGGKALSKIGKGISSVGVGTAKKVGRLGEGIKRGFKQKLAEKMPFMLRDEEIETYKKRLELEMSYKDMIADHNFERRKKNGESVLKEIARNSAKTLANRAVNKLADELLKSKNEREREDFSLRNEARLNELRNNLLSDERKNRKDSERRNELISKNRELDRKLGDLKDKLRDTNATDPNYLSLKNRIRRTTEERRKNGDEISKINDRIRDRGESLNRQRNIIASSGSGGGGGKGGGK